MAAQLIFALYFAAVALTLGMAIYCQRAAWDQTRPWMPAPLQDRISTAFDGFIWGGGVPDAARRNYLRAQLFVCVAGTLMTIVAFLSVALKGMLWFGGLTAFFVIRTVQFWLRYRRLARS
jgi:hypothetical protein